MDRGRKKRLRDKISQSIDITSTRLSDDEALELSDFVDDYDSYAGTSKTRERSWKDWSSDGYYRQERRPIPLWKTASASVVRHMFTMMTGRNGLISIKSRMVVAY